MRRLVFGIFSDYHLWRGRHPQSAAPLAEIVRRAHEGGASFLIHCGDLCHNAPDAPEVRTVLRENPFGMPVYGCIGNHELEDADSLDAVLAAYGMPSPYYFADRPEGFRLIVLDTNHGMGPDGTLCHYPPHSKRLPEGDRLGGAQLDWLENAVRSSPMPCLLFSHASLETPAGSPDGARVRALIREENERRPGHVLLCANGHNHTDSLAVRGGALWFDVNAALLLYWSCTINPGLPEDFRASARMAGNYAYASEPLSALVEIAEEAEQWTIRVRGRESTYLFGAPPDPMGGNVPNRFGRLPSPRISSGAWTVSKC